MTDNERAREIVLLAALDPTIYPDLIDRIAAAIEAARAEQREEDAKFLDKLETEAREEAGLLSGLSPRAKNQRWRHAEAYKAGAAAIRGGSR